MIACSWRGWTKAEEADAYEGLLKKQGAFWIERD